MARSAFTAACLLALIVVAQADRVLLQQAPRRTRVRLGGSTVAVGISTNGYFLTNGNGTWSTSPYGAAPFAPAAYTAAAGAIGAGRLGALQFGGFNTAYQNTGLTAVAFPSRHLGIAVGANLATATTVGSLASPNILISNDGAQTWMSITGLPQITQTAYSPGFILPAFTTQVATMLTTINGLQSTTPNKFSTPPIPWFNGNVATTNLGFFWFAAPLRCNCFTTNAAAPTGALYGGLPAGTPNPCANAPAAATVVAPTLPLFYTLTTNGLGTGTAWYPSPALAGTNPQICANPDDTFGGGNLIGTTGTLPPFPAMSGGDLSAVYFATKTLGWAVGGNSATAAQANPTGSPSAAYIFMTTNGGTVWSNVPLFYNQTSVNTAFSQGTYQGTYLGKDIPGYLFGISGDSAARSLWAVGAAPSAAQIITVPAATYLSELDGGGFVYGANGGPIQNVAGGSVAGQIGAAATANAIASYQFVGFQQRAYPTILYSSTKGASWVMQAAPVNPVAPTTPYALLEVAAIKASTAVAVGGTLSTTSCPTASYSSNLGCLGNILFTQNSGVSWQQATFTGNNLPNVPTLTSVAVQPGNTVWVGGFARKDAFYPVTAVAGFTTVGTATVFNGQTKTDGAGYTVMVSLDGMKYVPALSAGVSFPPGFVQTGQGAPAQAFDVLGITWDNMYSGYIYGTGFILSTEDGGKTWVFDSVAPVLGALTPVTTFSAVATVPTSY